MKGYSTIHVFNERERRLRYAAERVVSYFPDYMAHATEGKGAWLRCHEVARAVGDILQLEVQDGFYGVVEHSWCRISRSIGANSENVDDGNPLRPLRTKSPYLESWSVLDVYAIGRLPQVQLVSSIAGIRDFRSAAARDDIDHQVVMKLIKLAARGMKLWTSTALKAAGLDRQMVRNLITKGRR